jgi:hypothetical protein
LIIIVGNENLEVNNASLKMVIGISVLMKIENSPKKVASGLNINDIRVIKY